MLARKRSQRGLECFGERFQVSYDHVLGEGSYACVYKGLDEHSKRNVAVKVYKGHPQDEPEVFKEALVSFRGAVKVMQQLDTEISLEDLCASPTAFGKQIYRQRSFHPELLEECMDQMGAADPASRARQMVENMDLRRCFAQLISFSTDKAGEPGPDTVTGKLFIVTEMGQESLADRLNQHADAGQMLKLEELRDLQWSLVTIVSGLHAIGYVHLDIKPRNIMYFKDEIASCWRLIDFDGCVRTQTVVPREKVLITPWYMAPEIATSQLVREKAEEDSKASKNLCVTVSRLMDVWSVGMCALEAVFLQPILKPWYDEWLDTQRSTSQLDGCTKFLSWLADYTQPVMDEGMIEAVNEINEDMASMIRGMLAKNPNERNSITECLVHKWFEPIRRRLLEAPADPQRRQSKHSNTGRIGSKKSTFASRACSVM